MVTEEQVIEYLESLTLVQMNELVAKLEAKWDVKAAVGKDNFLLMQFKSIFSEKIPGNDFLFDIDREVTHCFSGICDASWRL